MTKTNKTCKLFHRISMEFSTKWGIVAFIIIATASVLICQLKYGLGQIDSAELLHSVKAVWVFYFVTVNIKCFIKKCHYRWPWSEESLLGYIVEIVASIIMFSTIMIIVVQMPQLFIFICIHLFTFNEMFASFVKALDDATEEEQKNAIFQRLIKFHVDIKRCTRWTFVWCYWIEN